MEYWIENLARHGAVLLFVLCLAEGVGIPIPAAAAIVIAGAFAALGQLSLWKALGAAVAAFLIADALLYILGRQTGWWLLGLLCRVSANPEGCIASSAQQFYKRGRTVLLLAKFVPGLNTLAAPMAGSMRMRPLDFLLFDVPGIAIYVGVYLLLGYVFHHFLAAILELLAGAGHVAMGVLAVALAGFVIYRILKGRAARIDAGIPRASVDEVGNFVVDVRSHGYYDARAERIKGSIRLEPHRLPQAAADLPETEKIYLYCT